MKFLVNRSLKELAIYVLTGLLVIFLMEFFIINYRIGILQVAEERKDFGRSAQIEGQQIAYLVLHLDDGAYESAELYARINELDHRLKVLGDGGRIDNTETFLTPLSRLPRITYDQLSGHWKTYKENVTAVLTQQPATTNQQQQLPDSAVDSLASDSTGSTIVDIPAIQAQASGALLPGQWLTLSKWYDKLLADLTEEAEKKESAVENLVIFLIVFDVLLLASLFYLFYRFVLMPLRKLQLNTIEHKQDESFPKNEIGTLANEVNLIIEQLEDATEFVSAISEGKLDYDYTSLDHDYTSGKNKLADSLIVMQQKLKALNEDEQRRNWANEGLTKFVDILRSSDDNINTLGDKIISALVKYTNSNQGGLYVLNDDDEKNKYLELISLFAFDHKKYETRRVKLGEGILGQTFLERETTILNEIPAEYIRITSGLGEASPKSLLLVPLKVDKEVYGIVELASFKNYQPHEISFVEKLAETIASTLASVKVGQKNRQLIEQFQQQTEEMRSQEEEMRQNMEELQATQEELSRKEQDYVTRIQELEKLTGNGVTTTEIERLKRDLATREEDYQRKVKDLERKLSEKVSRADDWAVAEDLEKQLQIHIEALKITHEELSRKTGQ
jgi:putative methionine-R-sulfoxide reductase with GAF domain